MAVGDVNSQEKGSGARFNDGKTKMDYIPVRIWRDYWAKRHTFEPVLYSLLSNLVDFQEGDDDAAANALTLVTPELMDQTIAVLDFGAQKYAAWNWAKGMDWNVPIGCILRHSRAIIEREETNDPESGLPHEAHIVCNLVMLAWFSKYYREGDDRPPAN